MFRIQNPNWFFRVNACHRILATLALVLTASGLRAQPAAPASRASFFTELDYHGEILVVETGASVDNLEFLRDSRGRPFNDRFRSVRIEGPVRVAVFEHSQFRGAATWLNRATPDLTAFSLGQTNAITWDRAISSIQVEAAPTGPVFFQWSTRDADRALRAAYRDVLNRDPDPTAYASIAAVSSTPAGRNRNSATPFAAAKNSARATSPRSCAASTVKSSAEIPTLPVLRPTRAP